MKKVFSFTVLFFLFLAEFYAQTSGVKAQNKVSSGNSVNSINVISPIEGTWLNKQLLVIDNSDGGEYFYSLNGSDPETTGFAYDGPVLIDLTGDIELRIARYGKNSVEKTVKFKVYPDEAYSSSYKDFIYSFYDSGILNYTSGSVLTVPGDLMYSFGLPPDSFIQGRELSISDKSVLIRYIPCTLLDPVTNKKWRFIIKTFPQSAGVFSRRDVPFYITDWETLTFTNDNFIYKIDSEYWELPKTSRKLDRSVSHMISWQSIDYEFGNPIEYFVLPPKPSINQSILDDGCVVFNIDGDSSYSFCILSDEGSSFQELYTTIGADTFYGDNAAGKLRIGIFSNSVYQGEMEAAFDIKKRPPSMPVITSSVDSFYSRSPVKVSIVGEKNCDLYISTSSPYFIKDMAESYTPDNPLFEKVKMSAYKKADSRSLSFMMEPQGEGTPYYKVRAYSVNGDNAGNVAEYSVIIDQYNYYIDASANPLTANGTAQNPYTNFEQCAEAINKGSYARLWVKGPVKMPDSQIVLNSNCTIISDGNASLQFSEKGSLVVRNSNLTIEGCRIEIDGTKESPAAKIQPVIKLENAVLDVLNCQISARFGKNGTFIDSFSSSINFKENIIAISSKVYASCVSGVKTKFRMQNSSVNLTSDTAVAFSLNQGDIMLKNNSCKIIGNKGRVAELFDIRGSVIDNSFKADLKRIENVSPVYKDSTTQVKEVNNEYYGF